MAHIGMSRYMHYVRIYAQQNHKRPDNYKHLHIHLSQVGIETVTASVSAKRSDYCANSTS